MKTPTLAVVVSAYYIAAVSAHGNLTSPPARQVGAAMAALCGQTAVDTVNSDPTIPIEDLPADALANANCKLSFFFFLPPSSPQCASTPPPTQSSLTQKPNTN